MSMTEQEERYYQLVDFVRDTYLAISGQAKKRMLTQTETLLLHKCSGLLADFTSGTSALSQECERRYQNGASYAFFSDIGDR